MKSSTKIKLQEMIRRIIKEENGDIDINQPFWVIEKGGSIGSSNKLYVPGKGRIVKTFDSKEEASDYAKGRRKHLSKGEKSYYGMGYIVMAGSDRMRQYLNNKD